MLRACARCVGEGRSPIVARINFDILRRQSPRQIERIRPHAANAVRRHQHAVRTQMFATADQTVRLNALLNGPSRSRHRRAVRLERRAGDAGFVKMCLTFAPALS